VSAPDLPVGEPAFWPSQYTAALLHVLRLHAEWVRGARVLEIGCGSGVLLAAAGTLGAAALCGVDVEPAAVAATRRLLQGLDPDAEVEVHQGDLFAPVDGRRFDLIVANLPHFPMETAALGDRLPSWSSGGADGRSLLDPFVAGLGGHLTPSGRAVIAHNAFVDLDATKTAASRQGLRVGVAATVLVDLPPPKLARMTPGVLRREAGRSIHLYGGLAFGEILVLTIGRDHVAGDPP
jgi:release factor glutamine methyltransferase